MPRNERRVPLPSATARGTEVRFPPCVLVATLTTVSREPGQALTGAAISGVALCEGCLQPAGEKQS